MRVCSELPRDACCYSGGWHGYCAGMCAANLSWCQLWGDFSSQCRAAQLLGNLLQLQWDRLGSFVLLRVAGAAGNGAEIVMPKSFVGGIRAKEKATLRKWCNAALGFLGAGRGFRECSSPASSLPSVTAGRQGRKNLIKRYSRMIISGYLPQVRHLFQKGPTCFRLKFQLLFLLVKIQKLDLLLLFFWKYKGNRVCKGCKEQRAVRFTQNREEIVCE